MVVVVLGVGVVVVAAAAVQLVDVVVVQIPSDKAAVDSILVSHCTRFES